MKNGGKRMKLKKRMRALSVLQGAILVPSTPVNNWDTVNILLR